MSSFAVCRLYFFNLYCFQYLMSSFNNWSLGLKIGNIIFFILMSLFNFMVIFVLGERLYRYMTPEKKNENEMIKNAKKIQRVVSNNILTLVDAYEKSGGIKIKPLPFRRMFSEPVLSDLKRH